MPGCENGANSYRIPAVEYMMGGVGQSGVRPIGWSCMLSELVVVAIVEVVWLSFCKVKNF